MLTGIEDESLNIGGGGVLKCIVSSTMTSAIPMTNLTRAAQVVKL
jgi:hypothetical protein